MVDSSKTKVRILIFWVNFNTFLKPFDCLIVLTFEIINNSNTIIGSIILRIDIYRLLIVFDSLVIIFLSFVSNTNTIISPCIIFIRLCQFNQRLDLFINIFLRDSDDIVSIDIIIAFLFGFVCPLPGLLLVVLLQ